MAVNRWLKEPLIHFLLLGGLIFALYNELSEQTAEDEIFISRGQQENLLNTFSRTWQRPPTPLEFQGLLKDYIRQEIAYREAREIGLDQEDIIIRRRLRQKMESLAEDVAALVPPTEEQLEAYLREHPDRFRVEAHFTFRHIYFSADRRGDQAWDDAQQSLAQLNEEGGGELADSAGDTLPLPAAWANASAGEIDRIFGSGFAQQLEQAQTETWSGPWRSGFGLHLVWLDERWESRLPELAEVREMVQREWLNQRREESVNGLYDRLAENYVITIEPLVEQQEPDRESP